MTLIAPAPPARLTVMTVAAPAKINLTLRVLGPRPDGYHAIRSLVVGVDLADRLTLRAAPPSIRELTCDDPSVPANSDNLVWKAAEALAGAAGISTGWSIDISKRIPAGGGLGGGSSDAAATLQALNNLWRLGFSTAQLAQLGAAIGSDVPLFFHLPSAVISGRGEQVQPVRLRWTGWVTLLFGRAPVSTRQVYSSWRAGEGGMAADSCSHVSADGSTVDRCGRGNASHAWSPTAATMPPAAGAAYTSDVMQRILDATSAEQMAPCLFNDLEPAIFRVAPRVAEFHDMVRGLPGGAEVRVSGAGSTLFALFDTFEEARALSDAAAARLPGTATGVVRPLGDSLATA